MTNPDATIATRRGAIMRGLLPAGLPRLWCPLLSHYRDDGTFDLHRTALQLDAIRPFVGGLLLAGSTGDGWELDEAERQRLIAEVLPLARARGFAVLVGVLKSEVQDMRSAMDATLAILRTVGGSDSTNDPVELMARSGVAGMTLCPPAGAALPQAAISAALDALLATGAPISLYQLPQVTQNEMDAATVSGLVRRHPNLLMIKDTSGTDGIAEAGVGDVVLLRGAEGGYARHTKSGGGRYDGFLLSTANGLADALSGVLDALEADRREYADELSNRIEAVVKAVFEAAAPLPHGNPFTNANKAIDHVMAHGQDARGASAPRLHSGMRLPAELIATALEALGRNGLLPERGYLSQHGGQP